MQALGDPKGVASVTSFGLVSSRSKSSAIMAHLNTALSTLKASRCRCCHHCRHNNMSAASQCITKNVLTVFQAEPLAWEDANDGSAHDLEWLDIDSERESLTEALKGTNVDVAFKPATPDLLGEFLAQGSNQVLHLSCHSHVDCAAIEDGWGGFRQLLCEDLITWMKAGQSNQKFVFVSACDSRNAGDALVAAGVAHVICCQETDQLLSNAAAREFVRHFYRALALGNTVKVAFNLGKQGVKNSGVDNAETERNKFALLPQEGNHDVGLFTPTSFGQKPIQIVRSGIPNVPRLVGRDVDMYHVLQNLVDSRLVRVTGPPGVGKGSLAKAVGHYLDTFWLRIAGDCELNSLYMQLCNDLIRRKQVFPLSLDNPTTE